MDHCIYGLVHAVLLWSKNSGAKMKTKGFKDPKQTPVCSGGSGRKNVVIAVLLYVDDLLLPRTAKEDEQQALKNLRSSSWGGLVLPGMSRRPRLEDADGDVRRTPIRAH